MIAAPHKQQSPVGAGLVAKNQTTESASIIGDDLSADKPTEKEINNGIAHLALNRHVVHRAKAGDFIVCKYGMSRYCRDGAELLAFARQLGVLHG